LPSRSDSLDAYERLGLVREDPQRPLAFNGCNVYLASEGGQQAIGERSQIGGTAGSIVAQDESVAASGGSAAASGEGAAAFVGNAAYRERWQRSKAAILLAIAAAVVALAAIAAVIAGDATLEVAGFGIAAAALVASGLTPLLPSQ